MTFFKGPSTFTLRDLDRLIHPRVPPLVRALPLVESLCLFRSDESLEERELRESLRMATSPRHDKETEGAGSQPLAIGPALASQDPHPNLQTMASVGAFIAPAPPLSPYPQSAPLVSSKPSPAPSHTSRVSSPSQLQSQAPHPPKSNDTWRPVQAQGIAPVVSGDVEVSEKSRSAATAEMIYLGGDEDDDDEMPSIDMESDSD